MKKRLLLFACLASIVLGDPEIAEKPESSRYARLHTSITHPQTGNKYSSVSSSVVHSTSSSPQNLVQTTQKPASSARPTLSKNNIQYNVPEQLQPPTANAGHFVFGVNPAQGSGTQGFIPSAGPMLMQILTPQGQPTGQVQYIQFLRPVMVPIVPQPYMQTTLNQGSLPSLAQPLPQTAAQVSASAAVAHQYLPTTPQPPTAGFYPYAQQPLAAFSSPVASFYHPNIYSSNRGVQVVNPPSDLSLNTDEYMPSGTEMSYKIMKPIVRS